MLNARYLLRALLPSPKYYGQLRCLGVSSTLCNTEVGSEPSQESETQDQATQNQTNDGVASAHTEEDPYTDDVDGEDQLRIQILDAALPFVHSLGWSEEALAQGAESLGYSGMAHGMFQNGGVELVNHFYITCNNRLQESLEREVSLMTQQPELKRGTTAFIASALEERLRMNIEYIDQWHRALALHASPLNTCNALNNLTTLVDHIWYYAGDRSTDFSWYTRRGILAGVYKTSEIYMLQDKSEDFQETWAFMNRRLSDAQTVGKCARSAESFVGNFAEFSKAGLGTMLNVLGMNSRNR